MHQNSYLVICWQASSTCLQSTVIQNVTRCSNTFLLPFDFTAQNCNGVFETYPKFDPDGFVEISGTPGNVLTNAI
jgi:hypothetical protein